MIYRKSPRELTRREVEIVQLMAKGMTNREIAVHLEISEYTVAAHLQHAFIKTGTSSRAKLARLVNAGKP